MVFIFCIKDQNIMSNYISTDLLRDIISYIPLETLKDLSRASPIMDREICNAGIRVFFDCDNIGHILDANSVVIRMKQGRAYLLRDRIKHYECSIGAGNAIIYNNDIQWKDSLGNSDVWYVDPINCIVTEEDGDFSYFVKYDSPEQMPKDTIVIISIIAESDIDVIPKYIDMNTRLALHFEKSGKMHVEHVMSFDVVFCNNCFNMTIS